MKARRWGLVAGTLASTVFLAAFLPYSGYNAGQTYRYYFPENFEPTPASPEMDDVFDRAQFIDEQTDTLTEGAESLASGSGTTVDGYATDGAGPNAGENGEADAVPGSDLPTGLPPVAFAPPLTPGDGTGGGTDGFSGGGGGGAASNSGLPDLAGTPTPEGDSTALQKRGGWAGMRGGGDEGGSVASGGGASSGSSAREAAKAGGALSYFDLIAGAQKDAAGETPDDAPAAVPEPDVATYRSPSSDGSRGITPDVLAPRTTNLFETASRILRSRVKSRDLEYRAK